MKISVKRAGLRLAPRLVHGAVLRELRGVVRHAQQRVAQRVRARGEAERQVQRVSQRWSRAVEHLPRVVVVVLLVRVGPAIARDQSGDVAVPEPRAHRTQRLRPHAPTQRHVAPDVAEEIRRARAARRAHRSQVGEQVVDDGARAVVHGLGGRLGIVGANEGGIAGHGRGARAFPRGSFRIDGFHARVRGIVRVPTRDRRRGAVPAPRATALAFVVSDLATTTGMRQRRTHSECGQCTSRRHVARVRG